MEPQTQVEPPEPTTKTLFRRQSTMDPKVRFYNHFTESVQGLHELVGELSSISSVAGERQEAIDHILAGIAKLQNEVADAADFTPSYDRKQYSESIKALQESLNETIAKVTPKSRFQFRRAPQASHVDMGAPENDPRLNPGSLSRNPRPSQQTSSAPDQSTAPDQADTQNDTLSDLPSKIKNYNEEMARPRTSPLRKPSFTEAKQIGISNHSGLHIILPPSAASATAAGSLTDLSRCIVDMSVPTSGGSSFPGLALQNISKSLIVAGRVSGPVHITGITNSILVVVARQVRIHECKDVDIYLHCGSHPIIEDCSGMRFSPLPSKYMTEAEEAAENQWDQVDDFKWLKAGHSPNWATLSESERLGSEIWEKVVPGQPGVSVEETLRKVGIS